MEIERWTILFRDNETLLHYRGSVSAFSAVIMRKSNDEPFVVRIFTDYPFELSPVWQSLQAVCPSAVVSRDIGICVTISDADLVAMKLATG